MLNKLFKAFRRFINRLFSRFVIVGLLIIAQVVLFGIFLGLPGFPESNIFGFTEEQAHIANAIIWILGALLILVILNKDGVAEYKLPWLLVVALFPSLGIAIYLFFGSQEPGRRMKREYAPIAAHAEKCITQDEVLLHALEEKDPVAAGQAKYLYQSSHAAIHSDTYMEYYPFGEDMFPALVRELKKAKHFIFMEYFIVEEGEFWNTILDILEEKAAEGVEVRFMYDDVGSIGKVPARYVKKIRARGVQAQVFRPFLPFASVIHNHRDHRKITVIDNTVAFTGGVNLADEYINVVERFGRWKDNSVMLRGSCVKDITAVFLTLWDLQTRSLSDYEKYTSISCETEKNNGIVSFFADGPSPFYGEQVGKDVYLNILNQAKDYVYITTPYLVCDNEILSAIRLAARRGVDVRMITPHIPDKKSVYLITRSNYRSLLDAGVRIFEYTPGFIHAKTFLADDKIGVVSTINLDYRSLVHHFECGVWMYETDILSQVKQDLLTTMEVSREVGEKEATLNFAENIAKSLMQVFTPLL